MKRIETFLSFGFFFGARARFLLLSRALRFFPSFFCGYRFVLINKFSAQTGGLGIILKLL